MIGFSMSGNVLLKYLGERKEEVPEQIDSAVAVAPPIDLMQCGHNLRRGFNRIYDKAFTRHLKRMVIERHRLLPKLGPITLRELPDRLWQFDDQYTAPRSGFQDVEDYYSRSSAGPLLAGVRVPTLLLTARDDPLVPSSMFSRYSLPAPIELRIVPYGGHMGFVACAGKDPDRHWMDWRLVEWVPDP